MIILQGFAHTKMLNINDVLYYVNDEITYHILYLIIFKLIIIICYYYYYIFITIILIFYMFLYLMIGNIFVLFLNLCFFSKFLRVFLYCFLLIMLELISCIIKLRYNSVHLRFNIFMLQFLSKNILKDNYFLFSINILFISFFIFMYLLILLLLLNFTQFLYNISYFLAKYHINTFFLIKTNNFQLNYHSLLLFFHK
jgi:hypothetical protein